MHLLSCAYYPVEWRCARAMICARFRIDQGRLGCVHPAVQKNKEEMAGLRCSAQRHQKIPTTVGGEDGPLAFLRSKLMLFLSPGFCYCMLSFLPIEESVGCHYHKAALLEWHRPSSRECL